jgi:hypothetical protein
MWLRASSMVITVGTVTHVTDIHRRARPGASQFHHFIITFHHYI